jgi:nucleoside-diphosphate-sugar epimerase
MRIAVTGASGFIGRSLCARLSGAGHEVRALVRSPSTELAALTGCEQVPTGDLEGFAAWPRALEGAQAIVHLAAYAHGRGADASLERVNVDAALAGARAASEHAAHFLFVSSVKVHGERTGAPLSEASPLAPQDRYAESKARAEEGLRGIAGLRLTVLRPPLVYGPGVKANFRALMGVVARGVPLPLASVNNRRSLLYVGNFADAIERCLLQAASIGKTYLVADGAALSSAQLCRELGAALARPARLFPFPPAWLPRKLAASLEVDDAAIRNELGWRPPFSRQAGLQATADWWRRLKSGR